MEANMRVMGVLMGKVKEIPSVDPTLTKSGYAADAKVVGDRLDEIGTDRLGAEDVVNSLESDAEDKPLSAAMGKVLRSLVGSGGGGSAADVVYDGSESNLNAADVQNAITLLASMVRDCLPLEGGTMTGENIYMDNGNARIQGNENGVWVHTLEGEMDNNNRRRLGLYNSKHAYGAEFSKSLLLENTVNGVPRTYAIFGQHNKRSGFYEGDGSENRTINLDSIGYLVFVYASSPERGNVAGFFFPNGCVAFQGNDVGVISGWPSFSGEVLNIPSMYNEVGVEYYYYVL